MSVGKENALAVGVGFLIPKGSVFEGLNVDIMSVPLVFCGNVQTNKDQEAVEHQQCKKEVEKKKIIMKQRKAIKYLFF